MEADAKYSSEKERMEAPSTLEDRFVVDEKVASIWSAGIGVTEIVEPEDEALVVGGNVS